ncbi:DUF4377 domain-containing protein [Mariniflexile sp. HNIBRBA6329]|uniref:DUF4377 domain-containing protein n=1 Tax=Mariniflexile sp. HNIBRBA6329 TaxID=3373088 RepID=UPI003745C9B5
MSILKPIIAIILLAILNTSCSSTKSNTYWVNSTKKNCDSGAGKTLCLQVFKGEDLEQAQWTYFYAPIDGFTFEPGYYQKIKVSETPKKQKNTPADASSISYKLIEVIEKKQDTKIALHDIWVVTHMNEEAITSTEKAPSLEINLTEMRVFGNDGCNNYTGDIKEINSKNIMFDAIASTRKMCFDMNIPDKYNEALNNVASYQRDNLNLYFFDSNGNKTLSFKKVD